MSKESNNNKNINSSTNDDDLQCDRRPNELDENGASTGEISSNNNDGTTEQTRREENLFSLKHFLKQDPTTTSTTASSIEQNNQMSGVRPKIPSTSNTSNSSDKIRIKRSPRFSSFDSQASLVSALPNQSLSSDSTTATSGGSHSLLQSTRSFSNMNNASDAISDNHNVATTQKNNTPIQRSCSADFQQYDQRPISFLDSVDKTNVDMLTSDAFRDLYPNLMQNINPDNPSALLPDFVQDHLLMEKFYYKDNNDRSPIVSPLSSSCYHPYDHQLPDFTLNENDAGVGGGSRNYNSNNNSSSNNTTNGCGGDMPFDLMCNSNESSNRNATSSSSSSTARNPLILPLDLPIDLPQMMNAGHNNNRSSHNATSAPYQMHNNYELDLTARTDGYPPSVNDHHHHHHHLGSNSRNSYLPGGDNFQTLPDFLSDGHVHSTGRQPDLQELQETSPESELTNDFMPRTRTEMRAENNRLRRELKSRNQVISEQARRIAELESTLAAVRQNENAIQNLDDDAAHRSDQRATAAQNAADEYKKQVVQLTRQMQELRQENEILKEEGAVGGSSSSHTYNTSRSIPQSQQLAKELMIAASTAETNLRQLLNGVENLRLMARRIDTIDDSGLPRNDYSDCDDDDFAGPAL